MWRNLKAASQTSFKDAKTKPQRQAVMKGPLPSQQQRGPESRPSGPQGSALSAA